MGIVTRLQWGPESIPDRLEQPSPIFDREFFFGSRTVYYPGSGKVDGLAFSEDARLDVGRTVRNLKAEQIIDEAAENTWTRFRSRAARGAISTE